MKNPHLPKKISLGQGKYELSISEDKLQAFLSLVGEESSLDQLDWSKLFNEIKEQGVVYGLLDEPERIEGEKFLIARGKPPVPGKDAYCRVVTRRVKDNGKKDDRQNAESKINHRELGHVVNVRKDQLLLKKIPATEGETGFDVFGNEIKVKNGKDLKLKAGKGTEISEDGMEVRAAIQGEFILEKNKPSVLEEYEINSDIDLSTGNIRFSGVFLRISGQVLSGFKVICLGSIAIGKGVNNASVISDKSITVRGGIVGDESIIRALEDISVDFCENIGLLETKGDLEITDFIVQGHVKAGGDIKALQGKGAIIGGEYIAGGSVYALELGSDGEAVTSVTAGLDTKLGKRKEKLEQAKKLLRPKLNEYIKSINTLSAMKKKDPENFSEDKARALARMNKELPKLMDKDSLLSEKEEKLEEDLKQGSKQNVYVFGTLYPGVRVTIANASRVINSVENSVVLEYREKQQKIYIRPMNEEEKKMLVTE